MRMILSSKAFFHLPMLRHVSEPFDAGVFVTFVFWKGCVNHEMPPFSISQRDIVTKPRVAAQRLPWVWACGGTLYPNGVASGVARRFRKRTQPRWG